MFQQSNKLNKQSQGETLGYVTETYSHLDITLHSDWKRIGVNLSGGADSALLMFLLCTTIKKHNLDIKIDTITHVRCWDTKPWAGWVSMQVFNKLKSMFPEIIDQRHTNFIPTQLEHVVSGEIIGGQSGDQIIVHHYNMFLGWSANLDAIFNATSQNPDALSKTGMRNRNRNASEGEPGDLMCRALGSVNTYSCYPFKFVKKDWIVAQYHIYDILDLYNTTRSCEGSIPMRDNIREVCGDVVSYIAGMDIPTCNKCWWCEERAWAEGQVPATLISIKNQNNVLSKDYLE